LATVTTDHRLADRDRPAAPHRRRSRAGIALGLGIFLFRAALGCRFQKHPFGFAVETLEQFHQVMGWHGQLDAIAAVVLSPAEVLKQAEVFAELLAKALGGGVVLVLLQRDPDVADAAEVIADQFVEAVAMVLGDRADGAGYGVLLSVGHRRAAASSRRST
jgi:hypothetical protein